MNEPFWMWLLLFHFRRLIIELEHKRKVKEIILLKYSPSVIDFFERTEMVTYVLRKGLF